MQIKDNPSYKAKTKPVTFAPNDSVQQALEVMCSRNIGSIVVVNDDQTIAGIVTERDMMIRVLGARLDPEHTQLNQIMSVDVKVAYEDDDLVDWMQTMSSERFRHLPIVDQEGKLLKMVSSGDFVAQTWPDLYDLVRQDIKGRLGTCFQVGLVILAVLTMILIVYDL